MKIKPTKSTTKKSAKNKPSTQEHSGRTCPLGKHSVRTHLEHIPSSKKHSQGQTITRHEHCASNPSHKDLLSFNEIHNIANKNFEKLSGPPAVATGLLADFREADKYDKLIRGWTCYWNNIFNPKDPLSPNPIKALMATESGFNERAVCTNYKLKKKHAHGLLQVLEETAGILKDHKGELSNYLIDVKVSELYDPSVNICCGIRWLFQKKRLATARLGRDAT